MKFMLLLTVMLLAAGCGEADPGPATTTAGNQAADIFPADEFADSPAPLQAALAAAKEADRHVMVIYGAKTCPFSRQMEQQTLATAAVREAMADFVVVRLYKGGNAAEFEETFGVQPTPSVTTLDAEGDPIGAMLNGVVAPADFLAYTAWAKTGEGTQPAVTPGGG